MLDNINCVIFDFDYTLADSSKGIYECISYAFVEMGMPKPTYESVCKTIGMSLQGAFTSLAYSSFHDKFDLFKELYVKRSDEIMSKLTIMFDSVAESIAYLKSRNIKLGIVSTKFRYRIEEILRVNSMINHFDTIIGGEDVTSHKPDPEGLLKAINRIETTPSCTLYIGDSVIDAETAENCKANFVAVTTGTTSKEEFYKYKSQKIMNDLSELKTLFI